LDPNLQSAQVAIPARERPLGQTPSARPISTPSLFFFLSSWHVGPNRHSVFFFPAKIARHEQTSPGSPGSALTLGLMEASSPFSRDKSWESATASTISTRELLWIERICFLLRAMTSAHFKLRSNGVSLVVVISNPLLLGRRGAPLRRLLRASDPFRETPSFATTESRATNSIGNHGVVPDDPPWAIKAKAASPPRLTIHGRRCAPWDSLGRPPSLTSARLPWKTYGGHRHHACRERESQGGPPPEISAHSGESSSALRPWVSPRIFGASVKSPDSEC
jgi:hypothetical protein